eukprot:2721535-Rhodomonas_salina.1
MATSQDIRFMPLESVTREDRLHVATCHHAGAQDIIFGSLKSDGDGQSKRTAEEFSDYPYASLVMRQFARMAESTGRVGEENPFATFPPESTCERAGNRCGCISE